MKFTAYAVENVFLYGGKATIRESIDADSEDEAADIAMSRFADQGKDYLGLVIFPADADPWVGYKLPKRVDIKNKLHEKGTYDEILEELLEPDMYFYPDRLW